LRHLHLSNDGTARKRLTKFELIINLKTALGLNVPLHLQQLADEVIE
jgi:hypothetical protein